MVKRNNAGERATIHSRPWLLGLSALLLGAALTVLAPLLYYRQGGQSEANQPLRWDGRELRLTNGQGAARPGGLEIPRINAPGVVVWTPPRTINADLYRELTWRIAGLKGQQPLRLVWRTTDGQVRQAAQATMVKAGHVALQGEPDWQGMILMIGLFIPGPQAGPVTVSALELQPATLTTGEWWDRLWVEWTRREDWSQQSINFTSGVTTRPLAPLAMLVALGIGLSGTLYAIGAFSAGRRRHPGPFVALFLLGWLLLDLHWQWELTGRVDQTVARFAGKSDLERRLADLDGDLYRFLLDVRQRLPERPARLLIITDDRIGFPAVRARYHLLPHNSYVGVAVMLGLARPGDYVLLLAPVPEARYVPERKRLTWAQGQLSAEAQYAAPEGTLLRVLGPGG